MYPTLLCFVGTVSHVTQPQIHNVAETVILSLLNAGIKIRNHHILLTFFFYNKEVMNFIVKKYKLKTLTHPKSIHLNELLYS